jgi:hypothetical protein
MTVAALSAASIAVLVCLGYFLTSLLWPLELEGNLKWAFAPVTGAGICSIIFIAFRRPLFTVELLLLVVLAGVHFSRTRKQTSSPSWPPGWRVPASVLLLSAAVGVAVAGMAVQIEHAPYGDGDAVNIWTSHARYLFRDGQDWQHDLPHSFHADYPLLVPSMTARVWRYTVQEVPDLGGVVGALFTLSAVAVLVGVLMELRNTTLAVLIGLLLLSTPFYIQYGVSQSADVPLSLCILAAIALLCLQEMRAPDRLGLPVLAGFISGCAGWTKNEGLLFICGISGLLFLRMLVRPRRNTGTFLAFCAGILAPLAVIVWFKAAVAPPNDIFANRHSAEMIGKLLDWQRHRVVLESFWKTFWSFGNWLIHPAVVLLALLAVHGVDRSMIRSEGWLGATFVVAVVLAGYYAIYLITPMDLHWHLGASLPRLYVHVWPAFLLLAGLAARTE